MESDGRMRVAVIGAAVSANKGAASMFYGLVDGLAERTGAFDVDLLTTYPSADRESLDRVALPPGVSVNVVGAGPIPLLVAFFLALGVRLAAALRLPPGPLALHPLLRAVRSSDVVVDLAGISFADGRGVALLGYNSVMSLTPHLAGGTVVKGSQAIGPVQRPLTRTAARIVLPRMHAICARGAQTRQHLNDLGLDNVVDAADISFLMHGADVDGLPARPEGDRGEIVVMPSSVVDGYAERAGIDHTRVVAEVVDALAADGFAVTVVAHSFRSNGERSRMNDGPVVDDVAAAVTASAPAFHSHDLDPRTLRSLTGRADLVITGRFHGMVSCLEVGTVPVVIGWSHKYGEVLDQFGVPDLGLAVDGLSVDAVLDLVRSSLAARTDLEARMEESRPAVDASARVNIDVVLDAAGGAP